MLAALCGAMALIGLGSCLTEAPGPQASLPEWFALGAPYGALAIYPLATQQRSGAWIAVVWLAFMVLASIAHPSAVIARIDPRFENPLTAFCRALVWSTGALAILLALTWPKRSALLARREEGSER